MKDQAAFRIFFNGHLHPILREFEKKRKNLLLFLGLLLMFTIITSFFLLLSKNLALLLFVPLILWGLYSYMNYRTKLHIQAFKPKLIPDILRFMQTEAEYLPNDKVAKAQFTHSNIFGIDPAFYSGEDLIKGKYGQITYEISELLVMHPSEIKAKLEKVFDGVFLHAQRSQSCHGKVFIVPREKWQKNTRGIKSMVRNGAVELEKTGNISFDSRFRVFYDPSVKIDQVLSPRLQENLISYYDVGKSEVYMAFINQDFYLALQESFDLLDSSIFRSNLSFDKIYSYYLDLQFYMNILEDVDRS